jgi:RND family efflux transporter MFP subunit
MTLMLLSLAAAFGLLAADLRGQPPGAMAPSPVLARRIEERVIATGQTFVGTVVPRRVSTVGSPVDGRVEEFLVNEGDLVQAGQKLVQLRVRTLEIERDGARAALELRKRRLSELELTKPREIEQSEARMKAAEAVRQYASERLQRGLELFKSKALSEDELQERVSAEATASRAFAERQAGYLLATSGVWDERIAQAQAEVEVQKETINRFEYEISEHSVPAPFAGYVTREHTEEGQWVAEGGPVVDIVDIVDYVDVEASVLETYIAKLKLGQEAHVQCPALPGPPLKGKLELIVPQADVRSRTFPVKVRLENSLGPDGPTLKPGMFARVTLAVGEEAPALMVPKDALVFGADNVMVWVVAPNPQAGPSGSGVVMPTLVETGVADGEWMEVRGNLKPGQQVVVEGNERLRPGQPVTAVKPED